MLLTITFDLLQSSAVPLSPWVVAMIILAISAVSLALFRKRIQRIAFLVGGLIIAVNAILLPNETVAISTNPIPLTTSPYQRQIICPLFSQDFVSGLPNGIRLTSVSVNGAVGNVGTTCVAGTILTGATTCHIGLACPL